MIQWALIATAVAGLSIAAIFRLLQAKREQASAYEARLNNLQTALEAAEAESAKQLHIITAQQEVQADANEKKREIREKPDPGDRARAATDILSNLSGGRDSDSDGGTPAD